MDIQEGKLNKISFETIRSGMERDFLLSNSNMTFIKSGGLLDYFFDIIAKLELNVQDVISYIAEFSNPDNVTGRWQDALYERLGVSRLAPVKTSFSIGFYGLPNTSVAAKSLLVRDSFSNCEFTNSDAFVFDDSGFATVTLSSLNKYIVNVTSESNFEIVSSPSYGISLDNSTITDIILGQERETDEDYLSRFKNSKAINSKATNNANIANLSKYVDNASLLKIIDKNSDNSMEAYYTKIVVKHNTTNKIFAQAVFDTFGAGIVFQGNTVVELKDSCSNPVVVKFQNATVLPVKLSIKVLIRDGYSESVIFQNIKSEISSYAKIRAFGLQSVVYSTELMVPVLNVDGVEAVISAGIRLSDDSEFTDVISLNYDEVPEFREADILIEGVGR